ncbi:MAG: ATP phosphoribosyltransferase regulatory subunit [Rhizobiaceae bacterium]|nr:ATP phosphoribosyltransferase regulatory subunit [Rhizobiaceae bacterium]
MTATNLTRLNEFFTARDFTTPKIPLLQPADPFLDTAGEDMRRRIFITADRAGRSLCLRPEFTIPVCLAHLAGEADQGRYAYGGNVFRQRSENPAEFLQAGAEFIGGGQSVENDAACINTAIDALAHCGVEKPNIILGDQAVFEAVLAALDLPEVWRARLLRGFGDRRKLENDLQLIADGNYQINGIDEPLRKALADDDRPGVERWIADKMAVANLPVSGGRTAEHIAGRVLAKAALTASQLSNEQRETLGLYLQIQSPLGDAVAKLKEFSRTSAINIDNAIEAFSARASLLAETVGDNVSINWHASFGRRLDYYTGIVFEIFEPGSEKPVCGGGRYDHLMNMLGAEDEIPAIGFSIWLDRLKGEGP